MASEHDDNAPERLDSLAATHRPQGLRPGGVTMSAREDELRQEIATISDYLATPISPEAGFVAELTRTQMGRRLADLRRELDAAANRVIELHFETLDRPKRPGTSPADLNQPGTMRP